MIKISRNEHNIVVQRLDHYQIVAHENNSVLFMFYLHISAISKSKLAARDSKIF